MCWAPTLRMRFHQGRQLYAVGRGVRRHARILGHEALALPGAGRSRHRASPPARRLGGAAQDLQTEVVQATERRQVRARESSVQRRGPSGGSARTPILEGPRPSTGQRRARYLYTVVCGEPDIFRIADTVQPWRFKACTSTSFSCVSIRSRVPSRSWWRSETATLEGTRSCAATPRRRHSGWGDSTSRTGEIQTSAITTAAHAYDPQLPPIEPTGGSALADALSALAVAAAATVIRLLGPKAPVWHLIAMLARGQLLAPLRSD